MTHLVGMTVGKRFIVTLLTNTKQSQPLLNERTSRLACTGDILNCDTGPMELLHVSHCLLWLLALSHCLSQFQRVAACLSLSLIVVGSLSMSLWSNGIATFLLFSLMVSSYFSLTLKPYGVFAFLKLFPMVHGCL